MSSSPSSPTRRRLQIPGDLQEEWERVDSLYHRLVYIPRFLIFNGRQIARLAPDTPGPDIPGVVLSSLCENIRRSGTYQAALYFGGRNLYPNQLEGVSELRIRHMVRWFHPLEVLSILLMIYFHRYLAARSAEDTWSKMNIFLRRDLALGRRVGLAWPSLTPGRGMMAAGLRRVAQGFMLIAHKKEDTLTKLMNAGFANEEYSDVEKERKLCGYTHLTLAAYIAQQCGLGVPLTASFVASDGTCDRAESDERAWLDIRHILEELKSGTPSFQVSQEIGLNESDARKTLDEFYKRMMKDKNVFSWVNSRKEDVHLIRDHKIMDIA